MHASLWAAGTRTRHKWELPEPSRPRSTSASITPAFKVTAGGTTPADRTTSTRRLTSGPTIATSSPSRPWLTTTACTPIRVSPASRTTSSTRTATRCTARATSPQASTWPRRASRTSTITSTTSTSPRPTSGSTTCQRIGCCVTCWASRTTRSATSSRRNSRT